MNFIISDNMANCLKRAEKKCCSNQFLMVSSVKSTPVLLLFLTVVQHESGTRKTISLSVIAYNKKLRVVPCSGETKSYFYALVFPQVS